MARLEGSRIRISKAASRKHWPGTQTCWASLDDCPCLHVQMQFDCPLALMAVQAVSCTRTWQPFPAQRFELGCSGGFSLLADATAHSPNQVASPLVSIFQHQCLSSRVHSQVVVTARSDQRALAGDQQVGTHRSYLAKREDVM